MNILIACEESQAVANAFRELGHNAFSCDIQECSGGHPEYHIICDVLKLLNGYVEFRTQDGKLRIVSNNWDMIIAFPPCTHLAVSGARHFEKKRENGTQLDAIKFFSEFFNADCKKIAIENPVNIIGGEYIKKWFPDFNYLPKCNQIIQPYEFGHPEKKSTCLWLKGLPELIPTNIINPESDYIYKNGKHYPNCKTSEERSKVRSKTFPGVAKAMAEQWGRG